MKGLIGGVVGHDDGNAQPFRVVSADLLERILSFNVKKYGHNNLPPLPVNE
jgi:hypothetical protein